MLKRSIPVLLAFCALGVFSVSASAATAGPGFTLDSVAAPTNFSESENAECTANYEGAPYCDTYRVSAMNAGSDPTSGPVTLTDTLPQGVTARKIEFL